MTKPNLLILLSLLFFLLSACKPEASTSTSEVPIIDLNYNDDAPHNLFTSISKIEPILLETTEESTIARMDRVVLAGERIFIVDFRGNKLLCFKQNGQFIQSVGVQGRGPGEYLQVTDVSFNETSQELYALDYRKINVYHLNTLEYKRSINIDFEGKMFYNPIAFKCVGQDHFLFWNTTPDTRDLDSVTEAYHLISYEKGSYTYHLPYQGTGDISSIRFPSTPQAHTLIRPPLGHFDIYEYHSNEISQRFQIKVPNPVPLSEIKYEGTANIPYSEIPYDKGILDLFETNRYLFLGLSGENTFIQGLYDKEKGMLLNNHGKFHRDFPSVVLASGDDLYAYMQPYRILARHEKQSELDDYNSLFADALDLDALRDDMNPILFRMKLK